MCTFRLRGDIAFRFVRIKCESGQFGRPYEAPKLNGDHSNVPWATEKHINLIIPMHMSSKAENFVKFGPTVAEIWV